MCQSYRYDEGRPFGIGLQKQIPNHLVRLWSKALVVSNKEKSSQRRQVWIKEANESEPLMNALKEICDAKTKAGRLSWDKFDGYLLTGQTVSGVKVVRILSGLLCETAGTILLHANRKVQDAKTSRPIIGKAADGADLFVRALKAGNAARAKGQSRYRRYCDQLK